MAKVMRSHTLLSDKGGKVWVEAQLSEPQIKRLMKLYERWDIRLTANGSPNQLVNQLEAINKVI
jgi:hypothetical protein